MSLEKIEAVLSYVSIWSVVIPLFIGIILYNRLNLESQIILYIVIAAAIPQLLRAYIARSQVLNITYNLYTFIEFFLIYILLRQIERGSRKIYNLSLLIYVLIIIYFSFNFGIENRFLYELVSINNFFYIFWIFVVIVKMYKTDASLYFFDTKYSLFWYISGLLFYSTCTLIIFLLWNFIKSHPASIFIHLWLIHYIFNINMYISFSVGMYKNKYQPVRKNV